MDSVAENVQNNLPINLIYIPEMKLYSRGAVISKIHQAISDAREQDELINTDYLVCYAIFSHRWLDGGEPTYEEMLRYSQDRTRPRSAEGFRKLVMFCQKAQEAGYCWVWSDTCCINKNSSVELDESIRSMYRWYRDSALCIVHLSATTSRADMAADPWFTRGWTLQELLAPSAIRFYTNSWQPLVGPSVKAKDGTATTSCVSTDPDTASHDTHDDATDMTEIGGIPFELTAETALDLDDHRIEESLPMLQIARAHGWMVQSGDESKKGGGATVNEMVEDEDEDKQRFWNDKDNKDLLKDISDRTRIPVADLNDFEPGADRIREKMVWASSRTTTRVEDTAYSLIGIFDVALSIAYGEGMRAFYRLQQAIIGDSSTPPPDIFYNWCGEASPYNQLFASKPDCFTSVDVRDDFWDVREYLSLPADATDRELDPEVRQAYMVERLRSKRGDSSFSVDSATLNTTIPLYKVKWHSTLTHPKSSDDFTRMECEMKDLDDFVVEARDDSQDYLDIPISDFRAYLFVGVVDYDEDLPWENWKKWVSWEDTVEATWFYWPKKPERQLLAFLRARRRYTAILLRDCGGGHYTKVETTEMIFVKRPKKGWSSPKRILVNTRNERRKR